MTDHSAIAMTVCLSRSLSASSHLRSGDNLHSQSCEAFSAASSRSVVVWRAGRDQQRDFGYPQFRSRSHDAVIRVYDEAGDVIETHEHAGDFKEP
jgi:hypothetical protein